MKQAIGRYAAIVGGIPLTKSPDPRFRAMENVTVKETTKIRFNAIAGYARQPMAQVTGEELAYFENEDGGIMGLLIRDRADSDFAGMAFGRDRKLRFRWTSMTDFFATAEEAVSALNQLMRNLVAESDEFHYQGDEVGDPVNFFAPVHPPERLHQDFKIVESADEFSSARGIIEPMMRWHEDLDGNFIEQFQSTAFDQRIWELYLFAMLTEQGYVLDQANPVPDFIAFGFAGKMAIEAVTVGPTRNGAEIIPPPPTETVEQLEAYLNDYMPIKFGSPLYSKLGKKYWDHEHIRDVPFALAVADFSSPGSMVTTRSALERYLYGYGVEKASDYESVGIFRPRKILEHRWGEKVIPSGFFDLPESENVSAVISTTAGTISKFNRMGALAGFGKGDVLMIREGTCVDHDPGATNPLWFKSIVNADSYHESWVEGLDVYHNPQARIPLPEHFLTGAAHHYCDTTGNWKSTIPPFHPLASRTHLIPHVDIGGALEEMNSEAIVFWKRS